MKEYRVERENDRITRSGIEFFGQSFSKSYYENNQNLFSSHIHSAMEMLFVTSGRVCFYADDREYEAKGGEMILFRSNCIHTARLLSCEDASYYVYKVKPDLLIDTVSSENITEHTVGFIFGRGNDKCVFSADELQSSGVKLCFEQSLREYTEMKYGYELLIKTNGIRILLLLMRLCASEELWEQSEVKHDTAGGIYDAVCYIGKNYSQPLTAMDCAAQANMSYSHFSRTFKKLIGRSFREYLNLIRINRARKALGDTEKSVTDIAIECGFDNVSYFISVFGEATGMTPGQYRKTLR
ncbi:MAG: helix-turn-helix domain-containing protein [Ruminococcaceae bacterium]|nr:helix-turn-helix domain-containing protein [Oscillospiraceae bacterium]